MGGGGKGGVHIQPHPPVGVPPPPVVFARAGRLADTWATPRRPRGDRRPATAAPHPYTPTPTTLLPCNPLFPLTSWDCEASGFGGLYWL